MSIGHHGALLAGYLAAMAGWSLAARVLPRLWPRREAITFPAPWKEVAYALLGAAGVIAMGQLFVHHWLLPARGPAGPALEAANQLLIFAPILVVPLLRRQGPQTAWLPLDRIGERLLIGLALAFLAVAAFALTRAEPGRTVELYLDAYRPGHFAYAVQVLGEDLAIAILLVRLRAALGLRPTIVLVAVLFAAGHVPSLLATGASTAQLVDLLLDAALGVLVLSVVQRSADVWWFWCVHFAMDMMQFTASQG